METRSIQHRDKRNASELDQQIPVCISSIQSNTKGFEQGQTGQGSHDDNNYPILADTTMVLRTPTDVHGNTNFTPSGELAFKKPKRADPSTHGERIFKTSGMENYRERLAAQGISQEASNLIANARRKSSLANYESSWRKWVSWCSGKQIDPVQCPLNHLLDFLASLFNSGFAYRTINNYRSAISAYHEYIDGKPIGKHPKVCTLVAGVFNQRPPQPRYCFIWDVEIVLKYVKTSLGKTEELSDKFLTYKVTILMALASASRGCGLHNLDN